MTCRSSAIEESSRREDTYIKRRYKQRGKIKHTWRRDIQKTRHIRRRERGHTEEKTYGEGKRDTHDRKTWTKSREGTRGEGRHKAGTHVEETTPGEDYTARGKGHTRRGDYTERRLHREGREDIQKEELHTESLEQKRRRDYTEKANQANSICGY